MRELWAGIVYWATLFRLEALARLGYRSDVLIQLTAIVLRQGGWVLFIALVFARVPTVGGWTRAEVLYLYGFATVVLGLGELCFQGPWRLPAMIREGDVDRLLVRPLSPIVQVFALEVGIEGIGTICIGVITMFAAGTHPAVTVANVGYAVLALGCGVAIYASISLATNAVAFWSRDPTPSLAHTLTRLSDFTLFPLSLYPPFLAASLTWVIPFGFMGYVPVAYLLGKGSLISAIAMPLVAGAAVALARAVFLSGLRRYDGTGTYGGGVR